MKENNFKDVPEKPSVKDLIGLGSSKEKTNAVDLKRGLYL